MSDIPAGPPREKVNRVAVLCGIHRYPNASGFPPLPHVANEIDRLKGMLVERLFDDYRYRLHGDTVYRDDQLTRRNLLQLLKDLREYRNTESIFFYLAGHGHKHEGDTYFLTYDAEPHHENPGVGLGELRRYLDQLKANATFAVLDFCYSGAIPADNLRRLSILASSQGNQVSDAGGKSNSFTTRLIDAIANPAPDVDGYVLWERVADQARREHRRSLVATPAYGRGELAEYRIDWKPPVVLQRSKEGISVFGRTNEGVNAARELSQIKCPFEECGRKVYPDQVYCSCPNPRMLRQAGAAGDIAAVASEEVQARVPRPAVEAITAPLQETSGVPGQKPPASLLSLYAGFKNQNV